MNQTINNLVVELINRGLKLENCPGENFLSALISTGNVDIFNSIIHNHNVGLSPKNSRIIIKEALNIGDNQIIRSVLKTLENEGYKRDCNGFLIIGELELIRLAITKNNPEALSLLMNKNNFCITGYLNQTISDSIKAGGYEANNLLADVCFYDTNGELLKVFLSKFKEYEYYNDFVKNLSYQKFWDYVVNRNHLLQLLDIVPEKIKDIWSKPDTHSLNTSFELLNYWFEENDSKNLESLHDKIQKVELFKLRGEPSALTMECLIKYFKKFGLNDILKTNSSEGGWKILKCLNDEGVIQNSNLETITSNRLNIFYEQGIYSAESIQRMCDYILTNSFASDQDLLLLIKASHFHNLEFKGDITEDAMKFFMDNQVNGEMIKFKKSTDHSFVVSNLDRLLECKDFFKYLVEQGVILINNELIELIKCRKNTLRFVNLLKSFQKH